MKLRGSWWPNTQFVQEKANLPKSSPARRNGGRFFCLFSKLAELRGSHGEGFGACAD